MRERHPQDWVVDLAGRHALEAAVEAALGRHEHVRLLDSHRDSVGELDFRVCAADGVASWVELKAKHQEYRGWTELRPSTPERDLFIIDELALRKLLDGGRRTHLLIADLPSKRWVLFDLFDLTMTTKVRAVRHLQGRRAAEKGKLLIDLSDGTSRRTLRESIELLAGRLDTLDRNWTSIGPWPNRKAS